MNGMMEYDEDDEAILRCPECDHCHQRSVTCEQNLREERMQEAINRAEERYKREPRP